MKEMISITVERYDPQHDAAPAFVSYQVPLEEGSTVMGALLHIYDHYDSTLAFRIGCRGQSCGLCAMNIDGRPRLACTTALRSAMVIRPLQRLPAARDLVVERNWIMPFLRRFNLFVRDDTPESEPRQVVVPAQHERLSGCTECLSCLDACPSFEFGRDDLGGPYHFVKLAQQHWDPRDQIDRRAQAAALDIARCAECRQCACPLGIPIYKMAVAPLAGPVPAAVG